MNADQLIEHIRVNREKIKDCFKEESNLTAWEVGFLGNIDTQLKNNRQLSDRQQEILDDLITKLAERYD